MDRETREQILDVAQALSQQMGFNAFSYRDISARVGIRAASIHYHFPSKEDLGVALVERYRQRFNRERAVIDNRSASASERLKKYARLFRDTVHDDGKMCLCGMLASEFAALPNAMQVSVRGFFDENETWLGSVLDVGRARGELDFAGSVEKQAAYVFSMLEGAMLGARVSKKTAKFDDVITILIKGLAA